MRFEGVFETGASRDRVFGLVTDANQVGSCIPGLRKLEVKDDGEFDAVVSMGVSIIRGDVPIHFTMVEKVPPSRVKMLAHGVGLGSAVDVEMMTELTDTTSGGTSMKWIAEAIVSGKMASLGQGLVKAQAEKMIRDLFDCLRSRLGKTA